MKPLKLVRHPDNPILSPRLEEHYKWEHAATLNPAVTIVDRAIKIFYRAIDENHLSRLGEATLSAPASVETRSSDPVICPEMGNEFETSGIEDPRITTIDDVHYIVYNAASLLSENEIDHEWEHMGAPWRLRCSLLSTKDFRNFKRHGIILPDINTRDGMLFPEKIRNKYVLMHRIYPDMYISYSDDIHHFSVGTRLCGPRQDFWDNKHIGGGTPPIRTPYGWLCIYHGVAKETASHSQIYHAGILLLDIDNPVNVLYRSEQPILSPQTEYETQGYVDNVVFPTGMIEWNNVLYVYYGAADKHICVASIEKQNLYDFLKKAIAF